MGRPTVFDLVRVMREVLMPGLIAGALPVIHGRWLIGIREEDAGIVGRAGGAWRRVHAHPAVFQPIQSLFQLRNPLLESFLLVALVQQALQRLGQAELDSLAALSHRCCSGGCCSGSGEPESTLHQGRPERALSIAAVHGVGPAVPQRWCPPVAQPSHGCSLTRPGAGGHGG